jgi:signal transduction histidine kinase/CheY-like chemotaxis protein
MIHIIHDILTYRLDFWAMAAVVLLASWWFLYRSQRSYGSARLLQYSYAAVTGLLVLGYFASAQSERKQREALRTMFAGMAPTYAVELQNHGLLALTPDTPDSDLAYGALLRMQRAWQRVNPGLADIYTFYRTPEDSVVLLVDSETDYNHDGVISGEREQRTPIGELYEADAPLRRAFAGERVFDSEPYTDRWGTWVSDYVPVASPEGIVRHVVGVDFPAADWIWMIERERALTLMIIFLTAGMVITASSMIQSSKADATQRALTARELQSSKDAAEEASRLKGAFLANISHEIRTPLNGVIGLSDLLNATSLSSHQHDIVSGIHQSAVGLLTIINDVLDMSKIEAGRLEIEQIEFEPADAIETAMDVLTLKAQQKKLELIIDIDPELPSRVIGDPTRLRQVIINLVGNAVKFTDMGEVRLECRSRGADGRHVQIEFAVVDTGIGMPATKLNQLFDPFTQLDASTTRKYGGTGLGLSISRNLVRAMGGEVTVSSREGVGTRFVFTLPLEAVASADGLGERPCSKLEGRRVLILTENVSLRSVLERNLRHLGALPLAATSLDAAQLTVGSHACDVLIVDRYFEEHGVLQIADELRAAHGNGELPILALTTLDAPLDQKLMQRSGIRSMLLKPVRMSRLREALCQDPPAPRTPPAAPLAAAAGRTDNRELRILLVEDNPVNQLVATKMLERLGYQTEIANSGVEAIRALVERDYDLILMDCQMPEMDGFEATWRIRTDPNFASKSKIPIIALTANAQAGDRDRCLAAGMSDYLTKPLNPRELADTVSRWSVAIQTAAARAPMPTPPAS